MPSVPDTDEPADGRTRTRLATSGTLKPEETAAWRISGEGISESPKEAKYVVK